MMLTITIINYVNVYDLICPVIQIVGSYNNNKEKKWNTIVLIPPTILVLK